MIKKQVSNKFVSVNKTGVPITKTAGTVSVTPTISTEKHKEKAKVVLSAATKEKFLNSFVPGNRQFEGSKPAIKSTSDKNSLTKQTTEEIAGISKIAAKSGTTITPVGQINKQTTPQNNTKVTHTTVLPTNITTTNIKSNSVNKGKLEQIVSSLSANAQVKERNSKLSTNGTSGKYVPIPKENVTTSVSDSVTSLRSNKAVTTLRESKEAISSKNGLAQTVNSQNLKVAPKKRPLLGSGSHNNGTNKKAKLNPKPRLNGTHANLATAEENMKRISALKESLKIISENSTKSSNAGNLSKESSNSRIEGLVDNTENGQLAKDLGSKTSRHFTENIHTKNFNSEEIKSTPNKNSMKKEQNEKPSKQVTSPKLSLKRKQAIIDANASENISNEVIPLKYSPLAKKAKLETSKEPIPMGWKIEEKPKAGSIQPSLEVAKNFVSTKAPPPTQNSVPLHISSQRVTVGIVTVWNESDDNATKFNKLLEYSKSFMTATSTEKCTIVKNFHKLFKRADSSYVESSEFSSLLDSTLLNITDSKDTFIHLQKVKTELKAYKKSKNANTPSKSRRLSSSSDVSEAVSIASNPEIPSDEPPKQVPTPNLADKLASAIFPNFKQIETGQNAEDIAVKAYKKSKNANTPSKSRRLSNSSDVSEAVSIASNLEIPSNEPPKQVPTPNLADKLASAIFPNFKQIETGQNAENVAVDAFYNVPCSSKQADIIENLNFSMPVNNGVRLPSEFRTKASDIHRDKPSTSIPTTNNSLSAGTFNSVDKMADPAPMLPDSDPEIEVVHEVVIAVQEDSLLKEALLKNLNLQSVDQLSSHAVEPRINNLPPIPVERVHPVKEPESKGEMNILPPMYVPGVDQPKTSVENTHPVKNNTQSNQAMSNLPSGPAQEGVDQPKTLMSKIERRVQMLEAHLGKLDKKIKKLQAKELSMDDLDDEDSTYILEDKYKRKFQKTWVALCKVKKRSALVGREIERRFHYQGSRHGAFNKAIEKLVNKRKPAEKFPNFVEVHNLLKKVNEGAHLSLGIYEIENAAREAFEAIGKELKRRRQADEDLDFGCYLTDDIRLETDPAEHDEELKKKLTDSVLEGEKKIAEIIEKYAACEEPNAEADEGSNREEDNNEEEDNKVEEDNIEEDNIEEELNIDTPPTFKTETADSPALEDSVAEGSLQDPVGIEVTAGSVENTDLPDTDPATPETDEREDNATPPISVPSRPITDVIDIDSSSSASTDPGPNATERNSTSSHFVPYHGSNVFISDIIEIVDEPPPNYDDSSPELPPLAELCKM